MELSSGTVLNMAMRMVAGVFFACFILASVSEVNASARMTTRDLNVTFEMGRDATLTCTVRNIGKRRVIWRKLSDPFPLTVGTTKFWPGKKYRVKRDGDDWRLTIKDIQYTDAGEYECRLSGDEDVAQILSLIIPGEGRTHFLPTETSIATELGGDVTLPCHVNNLRKNIVLWLNKENQVLSLRKKIYSSDRKHYNVIHTKREEWSLQVNDVRQEDLGVYRCVVNTEPFLTRTISLIEGKYGLDKVPETGQSTGGNPQLVQETFRSDAEVSQYESVTLTCQFTGDPEPKVRWERHIWSRDGEKVVQDLKTEGETYTLTNAQPEDTGIYICRANNGLPPPEQGRIRVKVKEVRTTTTPIPTTTTFDPIQDAAPRVYPQETIIYQSYGGETELSCRGVGVPRPEVHWTFNGMRLDNDFKHSVRNEPYRHHTTLSFLQIRSLGPQNMGVYTCQALNRHGSHSAQIELSRYR